MARLTPDIHVDQIREDSERLVAKALVESLPDHCVVYHSYPWLRPERSDRTGPTSLREGEIDFLILHPHFGLMALEVKGGEIKYKPDKREWSRRLWPDGLKIIQDPFEQARWNMHFIVDKIKKSPLYAQIKYPFIYGYAVVFPHCVYSGPVPPGAEPAIVWDARDLAEINSRIERGFKTWASVENPLPLGRDVVRDMQSSITPAFKLCVALSSVVGSQEEALVRLTDDQLRVLDMLSAHQRVLIEGVAGSGKTMLARAQAQRFASEGKKTLLLCYNTKLASWLAGSLANNGFGAVTVKTFHKLCRDYAERAGLPFDPVQDGGDLFWKEKAPEILLDAAGMINERYDAIVVDEGQDFHPDWWLALEAISANGEETPLFIFYDPAQNLFLEDTCQLPIKSPPLRLPINCRNTRRIAHTCAGYLGSEIKTHAMAPDGSEPVTLEYDSPAEGLSMLREQLASWLKSGRLNPSQVAILSPVKKKGKTLLDSIDSLPPYRLTDDHEAWRHNEGVLLTTIRSFKGLEADAVLLIDAQEIDRSTHLTNTDYYVACSRAKHLLTILRRRDL